MEESREKGGSHASSTPPNEKAADQHVETVATTPEKKLEEGSHHEDRDGLRFDGDDEDHLHEPPVSSCPYRYCGIELKS